MVKREEAKSQISFPAILRRLRKAKGWTQGALADKVGVKKDTVSRWELGQTKPNPEQLKRLAEVLPASLEELLGVRRLSGDAETTTRLNLPRIRDRRTEIVNEIEQAIDGTGGTGKRSPVRKKTATRKKPKKKG